MLVVILLGVVFVVVPGAVGLLFLVVFLVIFVLVEVLLGVWSPLAWRTIECVVVWV